MMNQADVDAIIADLLAGYGKELSESEGRISSSIQQIIAKQTQAHIDEVVAKMNRSWLVAALIFFAIILLGLFIPKFV